MNISTQDTINEWSEFSDEDLRTFGPDGDDARKSLIDHNILDLLGPVSGKHILDAGCGNGYFARKIAQMGARVTAVEPAKNLFKYGVEQEKKHPQAIEYLQQDLTKLQVGSLPDAVVLINVLMDIPDYKLAMKNCIDAIKPGGLLVFSILHPAFPGFQDEWNKNQAVTTREYFNADPIKQRYGYLHIHPLQDYLNNVIQLGCTIEKVIEPQSTDENVDNRNYHVPQFLLIKARKK